MEKQLKELRRGELFRLRNDENAPIWIRDEYDKGSKTYIVYKWDNVNHFSNRKGSLRVFVD